MHDNDHPTATVTLQHTLNAAELSLMQRIHDFLQQGTGRTPKAYEVGGRAKYRHRPKPGYAQAFDRLKALGLVYHSPNGHCWLTDTGNRVLQTMSIDNAHHFDRVPPQRLSDTELDLLAEVDHAPFIVAANLSTPHAPHELEHLIELGLIGDPGETGALVTTDAGKATVKARR